MALLPGSLLVRSDAPTLDDARSAADALTAEGASEVWVYGSVARGEAHPGSDIDLIAIFDDLDYRKRLGTTYQGACLRCVRGFSVVAWVAPSLPR